jgi:hypothetical protein
VIEVADTTSVALAEKCEDWQEGKVRCLSGRNLANFDYVSVGKEGFVPVNVKPMITTWLGHKGE